MKNDAKAMMEFIKTHRPFESMAMENQCSSLPPSIDDLLMTVAQYAQYGPDKLSYTNIMDFAEIATPEHKSWLAKKRNKIAHFEGDHDEQFAEIARYVLGVLRKHRMQTVSREAVDTLLNPPPKACGFSGVGYNGAGMHVAGGGEGGGMGAGCGMK